jgi:hypothetical protein
MPSFVSTQPQVKLMLDTTLSCTRKHNIDEACVVGCNVVTMR